MGQAFATGCLYSTSGAGHKVPSGVVDSPSAMSKVADSNAGEFRTSSPRG